MWVSVFPPFRSYQRGGKTVFHHLPFVKGARVDVLYTKRPPPVAPRYKGTPKETVYTWEGPPPEELTLDMGIVDVTVSQGKHIRFERVRAQVTTKVPAKRVAVPRRVKYPEPEKLLYADIG
ncbi:hypothetical protein ES703_68057 [subsurface metagenome]